MMSEACLEIVLDAMRCASSMLAGMARLNLCFSVVTALVCISD
jgi:hypothetical protein